MTDGLDACWDYAGARESLVDLRTWTRPAASEFRMAVKTVSANVAVCADSVFPAVLSAKSKWAGVRNYFARDSTTSLSNMLPTRHYLPANSALRMENRSSNAYQAISRLPVAHVGSTVALAASGLPDEIDHDGGHGSGVHVPPVIAEARVLTGGAVVFRWALADLHSDRQRWRVCGREDGGVQRRLQKSE